MAESKRAIEAILLVSAEPTPPQLLAQLLELSVEAVEEQCRELAMAYDLANHGFQLVKVAGGWRYQTHPDLAPKTTICIRDGDTVLLPTRKGSVAVPYRPMIGTLGVAPADGRVESFSQRPDILGNVDLPELTAGAEVVLRANVDGGLLSLGDAHLTQGDAEIHRSSVETQADVTLSVGTASADDAGFVELPQINSEQRLGSVAPGPGHLEDLVRAAYDDLAQRLHRYHDFALGEAYRLLGAAGVVRIGQVVPPVFSALAMIDRRHVGEVG